MKRPVGPLLCLAIGLMAGSAVPLAARPVTAGYPVALLRSRGALPTEDEEQDAREIAARVNEALNIRREVTITLHNDTVILVSGRVTAQRTWLIITSPDGTEVRFRAAMIASIKIK